MNEIDKLRADLRELAGVDAPGTRIYLPPSDLRALLDEIDRLRLLVGGEQIEMELEQAQ